MKIGAASIQAHRLSAGVICASVIGVGDMHFDMNTDDLKVMTPDGKVSVSAPLRPHLPNRIFDLDISYPCSYCGRDFLLNKPDHARCDGCGAALHRVKPVVSGGRNKYRTNSTGPR